MVGREKGAATICSLCGLLTAKQHLKMSSYCWNTAPVLAAPRLDQPFKIQVDASQVGAGAALMQVDENNIDRPVYYSKKFT